MKKLLLSGFLAVILLSAITGSIAYFTDSISNNNNTIASGNIKIALHEYERTKENGVFTTQLQDFSQDQMIYPSVATGSGLVHETVTLSYAPEGQPAVKLPNVSMPVSGVNNFVDKIVTAENIGSLPAYVRVFVAVPTLDGTPLLHPDLNKDEQTWVWTELASQTINGRLYNIHIATHLAPLAPGAATAPSLLGFYLDSTLTNELGEKLALDAAGTLNILVAIQATQANVFDPGEDGTPAAHIALNTVFDTVEKQQALWNNPDLWAR